MTAPWTDDRVSTLRRLWAEGLSASQIARQLTQTTRNAVIGKVHRIGLAGRASPARPPKTKGALRRRARVYMPGCDVRPPIPLPAPPIVLQPSLNVPLDKREAGQCGAVTDSTRFAQRYCGQPVTAGSLYCAEHHRLHYQPTDKAKKKKQATERLASFLDGRGFFQAKNAGFTP